MYYGKKEDSFPQNWGQFYIEESQAGWGGKGPLEMVLFSPLSKAGSSTARQQCSVLSSWVLNFFRDGDSALFTSLHVKEGWDISFDKLYGDRKKSDEPLDLHWGLWLMEDSPVCDDQAFLPARYIQQYDQDGKFQDQK